MAYIELLDIEESAGAHVISERLRDRYQYFKTLTSTAPTVQLKAIYEKKLADLLTLAREYSLDLSSSSELPKQRVSAQDTFADYSDTSANQIVFLVLHTEGRPLQSFPLLPGINILGRSQSFSGQTILIDDDYMSRAHAVIEVTSIKDRLALLYDIGELPGYKSSTNGVYLNGGEKRLSGKVSLNHTDTIQVGYAKLVLTYAAASEKIDAVTAVGKKEHSKTVFIKLN
jgi:FHA domain